MSVLVEGLIVMSQRNVEYAQRLVADLTPQQMVAQPAGLPAGARTVNHAAWVLGHLAAVNYLYAGILGDTSALPPIQGDWNALFLGKSAPQPDAALYPDKDFLFKVMSQGSDLRAAAARAKPDAFWTQAPEDERRKARFGTNAAFLVHMLVNHDAIHLGQLSAWRRTLGLPSV